MHILTQLEGYLLAIVSCQHICTNYRLLNRAMHTCSSCIKLSLTSVYNETIPRNNMLRKLLLTYLPRNEVDVDALVRHWLTALLEMGSYSSTLMCQYWDNRLIY